ncbi:FAD/NAD(P)-binding domain-containing protein [Boletus edulis BED1]|uniref:FAD/NAD(P)-binding domain-containing protein n=1 Tax=Boletus edulis BED1 TaxID=1328754 RepID=A0AAD4GD51_BOLED|nr:FAD/NAD(P)-binding domain-containing protein [Boletus edulis BED1]
MNSTFRVSICGGGIGGLMLAVVIGKYGTHPVDVFEAGPTITTFGAGISLFGRTMDVMKDLGLYDEFIKLAVKPPQENTSSTFRKSDQRDGYHWFSVHLKHGQLMLHRKDVVDFLLRHLPASCKIHTSKKLNSYEVDSETGKTTLHFSDGDSTVTDVLVGADGIHSATRGTMYKKLASSIEDDESRKNLLKSIDPVWTGILVYRNLVPTEKLLKAYPDLEPPTNLTMHLGESKHIVTFPVSDGKLINVVIFHHNCDTFGSPFKGRWVTDVPEEEVLHLFEGWDIRAEALVKCVERPSRWALHSLRPLPHYVDGAVALLGDAAHAMEPHFGAGAGQAMEDAYVLGRLLTHDLTHPGNVADALKTYEEARLPFANSVVQRSHTVARYYSFSVPPEGSETVPFNGTPEELDYVRKAIVDAWEWQSEPDRVWGDAEQLWLAKHSTPVSPKF